MSLVSFRTPLAVEGFERALSHYSVLSLTAGLNTVVPQYLLKFNCCVRIATPRTANLATSPFLRQ